MFKNTCDMLHMTRDTWNMTHDTWHMTHDIWHMTCDRWHVTYDTWHLNLFSYLILLTWSLFLSLLVLVLLTAPVERFSTCRMQFFVKVLIKCSLRFYYCLNVSCLKYVSYFSPLFFKSPITKPVRASSIVSPIKPIKPL